MLDNNLIIHAFPERVREMVECMLLTSIEGSVVTKVVAISRKFWRFFFVSCWANLCVMFITTVPLIPGDVSFKFSRLQFPLHLALVVSINKAQRQFLKDAGCEIETNCCSDGQLYEGYWWV
jgi:carbon starvation protein CstA